MAASSNYPSLLARVLGQRNTTNDGIRTLSWRGYQWTRIGAVWIPSRIATLQLDLRRPGV
jgi:hypothetical protein